MVAALLIHDETSIERVGCNLSYTIHTDGGLMQSVIDNITKERRGGHAKEG